GPQRADEGTARVVLKTAEPVDMRELASGTTAAPVLKTAEPVDMRELASGTTAAPLPAVADVERGADAATELSPMQAPAFSAMAHYEVSEPKPPQLVAGKNPTQHAENDAIKQPARDQVEKEEAERSATAAQ